MQTRKLHDWNLSYSQAIALQKRLANQVQFTAIEKDPVLIAGLDCALSKDKQSIIAIVVVLKTRKDKTTLWDNLAPSASTDTVAQEEIQFQVVETATTFQKITFPYIPGLLSFREAPACIAAVEKLNNQPDLFIVDGQGIAHPRRFGLAAHLGLFFDKPTIGCAKSRLTGTFDVPPVEKGSYTLLKDKKNTRNETIGAVVRTRTDVQPVFVSVGNKCTLADAVKWTLKCVTKYRLPEPTRLAHQQVSELKEKPIFNPTCDF